MQFVIDQLVTWWQFTVVGVLIIIGWIANLFGIDNDKELIGFSYKETSYATIGIQLQAKDSGGRSGCGSGVYVHGELQKTLSIRYMVRSMLPCGI